MKETSLNKRYVIKLLSSAVSGILNAIIVAVVPKALGAVSYGQFVYIQDFFTKIIGFLDMGTSTAFFTKLSATPNRKELIKFYFQYSLIVLFILFSLVFAVNMLGYQDAVFSNIDSKYLYLGIVFVFLTWLSQIYIKISDSYVLTTSVEIVKVIQKIVSLFLLLYFIHFTFFDLNKYFYFHYISFLFLFVVLTIIFNRKAIFENILSIDYSFAGISKEFIKYSHPLLITKILVLVGGVFDIWLLQKTSGNEQVGFYGLSYSLAAMCLVFTSAMTPLIMREFSRSYEIKDFENIRKLFYKYVPMLYSIATFFSVFIAVQSKNVLAIFTNDEFANAQMVLMIMAFYPIHQTYGQLCGSLFYATGKTKVIRNISTITILLGILSAFVGIYLLDLGAIGLAYKMVIVQIIGVNIYLFLNIKSLKLNLWYFVKHQIGSVIFFLALVFVANYFINFANPIFDFIISGGIYTLLVVVATYFLPEVFGVSKEELQVLINKIWSKK